MMPKYWEYETKVLQVYGTLSVSDRLVIDESFYLLLKTVMRFTTTSQKQKVNTI